MHTCFNCQKEFKRKNPPSNMHRPYCSRSCAATQNGHFFPKKSSKEKKELHCLFCDKKLAKAQVLYCSNACQNKEHHEKRIANWLLTGETNSNSLNIPSWIKKFLLIEQKQSCHICQISNTWNNQELIFVCDHIDGNPLNDKRENLRLVCPNCDSQLPTYKAKNKGNGREARRNQVLYQLS